MTREELLAALENAEAGSIKLDVMIANFIEYPNGPTPAFSQSIDAALTLVPEGFYWLAGDCRREAHACVAPEGIDDDRANNGFSAPGHGAIALCIAALKART